MTWKNVGILTVSKIEELMIRCGTDNVRIETDGTVSVDVADDSPEQSYSDQEVEHKMQEKRFPVMEIFGPTLQGEGQMAGYRTMFIRFGGCDYRCKMCDSLHAVIPSEIKKTVRWLTSDEIATELTEKSRGLSDIVTFSGGNPCMWDLEEVVAALRKNNWRIAVETQGTIFQQWLREVTWLTISPKGPGMGERFDMQVFNEFGGKVLRLHRRINVSVKIVLFDQQDIEFAKAIQAEVNGGVPLYLSLGNPYPPNNPNSLVFKSGHPISVPDLKMELLHRMKALWEDVMVEPTLKDAIFIPQLHVLIWGNELGR